MVLFQQTWPGVLLKQFLAKLKAGIFVSLAGKETVRTPFLDTEIFTAIDHLVFICNNSIKKNQNLCWIHTIQNWLKYHKDSRFSPEIKSHFEVISSSGSLKTQIVDWWSMHSEL